MGVLPQSPQHEILFSPAGCSPLSHHPPTAGRGHCGSHYWHPSSHLNSGHNLGSPEAARNQGWPPPCWQDQETVLPEAVLCHRNQTGFSPLSLPAGEAGDEQVCQVQPGQEVWVCWEGDQQMRGEVQVPDEGAGDDHGPGDFVNTGGKESKTKYPQTAYKGEKRLDKFK